MPIPPDFVKPERDVHGGCARCAVQRIQIGVELFGTAGLFLDAALEEVTGERSFGEDEQLGGLGGVRDIPKHLTKLGEIVLIRTLVRAELDYRQAEHGGNLKGAGVHVRALRMDPLP
jgi:hypothetical protein